MTTRFTQDEWLSIIDGAEKSLPVPNTVYKAPSLGTEAFAKCMDHTLLKLDATKDQINVLCEEAKKYNFKVQFESASLFYVQINVFYYYVPERCGTLPSFSFIFQMIMLFLPVM